MLWVVRFCNEGITGREGQVDTVEDFDIVRRPSREERLAVSRLPVPSWVPRGYGHIAPVPQKIVHVEGNLSIRECRALFQGIKHQLSHGTDITITHTRKPGYLKTEIS